MENKNLGLIVVIIVLSFLVVILGGYVIFDKDDDSLLITEDGTLVNENTENSYLIFANKLKEQISKYDLNNRNYMSVKSSVMDDGYEVYVDNSGDLFIKYFDDSLNAKFGNYKVASNVLTFNVILTGQGGGNTLFFINEDGTVGSADIEYSVSNGGQIIVMNDLGYKNIVNIVGGSFGDEFTGVSDAIFIDINGNMFSTNLK